MPLGKFFGNSNASARKSAGRAWKAAAFKRNRCVRFKSASLASDWRKACHVLAAARNSSTAAEDGDAATAAGLKIFWYRFKLGSAAAAQIVRSIVFFEKLRATIKKNAAG